MNNQVIYSDYNDFCNEWYVKVKKMVACKDGIPQAYVEDVTQDILLAFVEKDYLNIFDSSKSKFTTFMYNFVNLRLLGIRDKFNRKNWVEGLSVDTPVEDGNFLDLIEDNSTVKEYEDCTYDILCSSIIEELSDKEKVSTINDTEKLFKLIVSQLSEKTEYNGKKNGPLLDRKKLAQALNVSVGGVGLMIRNLREELTLYGFAG